MKARTISVLAEPAGWDLVASAVIGNAAFEKRKDIGLLLAKDLGQVRFGMEPRLDRRRVAP